MNRRDDASDVDLIQLFRALIRKAGVIILVTAIFAGAALVCTKLFITPLYKATAMMYVNNRSASIGSSEAGISQGDLVASQSLVDTYTVILKTRATLNEVIEQENLGYTYEELFEMIDAHAVDATEFFYIEVTSSNPQEAERIANALARIMPERISSIVEGTSVRIADEAVVPDKKDSPSLVKNTILGGMVGFVLACGALIVLQLMDDKIHDSDYLLQTYDIPVLAVIPDLMQSDAGHPYGSCRKSRQGGRTCVK